GSSHKQISTPALWRIATPVDAGAIHPISNAGCDCSIAISCRMTAMGRKRKFSYSIRRAAKSRTAGLGTQFDYWSFGQRGTTN
ncbi:MAG: hypothetical protein ABJI96_08890, partial [Paracoccaceae bacterium]